MGIVSTWMRRWVDGRDARRDRRMRAAERMVEDYRASRRKEAGMVAEFKADRAARAARKAR